MAVAGNRVPPLQKRMVGNSGDVKGIKKKKKRAREVILRILGTFQDAKVII
jgi:hypothetical protein